MRLILPIIALFLTAIGIIFGAFVLSIISAHNEGRTGFLDNGLSIDPMTAIIFSLFSVLSLTGTTVALYATDRNLISLPRLRRKVTLSPAIRATIGTILVVASIALSSYIQGESILDLVWATGCLIGLYYGFKTLGYENLRKRGY